MAASEPSAQQTTAPEQPPHDPNDLKYRGTPQWLHNSAIAVAILGPIAMLMPPRRADLRSVVLSGGTFWATNQLAFDYTGQSIRQRFQSRMAVITDGGLPEQARRNQELIRQERLRREAALPEEQRKAKEMERRRKEQGVLDRLWMGGESENWKEERAKKEKEALDDGRGYQGLIMDQIWEVWTGKKAETDDNEAKTETVGAHDQAKKPKE